jgi:glycosyltransferase involved in cell wall biosynthesis
MRLDRVAYVCTDPGIPVFGSKGASVHVQEVLRQLVRRAGTVHLLAARIGGPPPEDLSGVDVHHLPLPPAGDRWTRECLTVAAGHWFGHVLRRLGQDAPPDLVYQRYALFGAPPMEVARDAGWPTVLEVNAPLIDEHEQHRGLIDRRGALEDTRRALGAAHLSYAVSSWVARWAASIDPKGRPVPFVPNGVDVNRFRPQGPGGTRPDELTVVFSGSFKPWHGLVQLVEAVARARARGARLRLLLLGDGPERAAVETLADRRRVPLVSAGALPPAAVPAALGAADIAAAPYAGDEAYFSPLKVAEYLACGLPTVASGVGDLPDLVHSPEEALLTPAGDVDALADALSALHDDPGLRARMSAAGRRAADERMTWTSVVDRVLELAADDQPSSPREVEVR